MEFLKTLGIKPPYGPAIPLLGIYPEETKIEKDTCSQMFIAALFIIARIWKQYSGLIFFRIDWFDLLAVQGTLKSLLQLHN